ncbi:DUF3034 domain-containing protein [Porphyrobacter sp. TH134]|uniref:DUF3034 family protein n=1 Tax=Porphyrobacter sp. TH134 TaxID=2067450 RepID=UPI000C7D4667|nr:DUF3034 family protein [Porphyrobacter sp. TH134]PLK24678.1 DUF3034 domain-containing protein [Porphyrobacter sp. TH134]
MPSLTLCFLSLCQAAAISAVSPPVAAPYPDAAPYIGYEQVLDVVAAAVPPVAAVTPQDQAATARAVAPIGPASEISDDSGPRPGKTPLFKGGKLLLTNGVTTAEGSSGGGIARWATIAGRQMPSGIGASAHLTAIELPDFGWRSYGAALGIGDRLELSIARADFDTRDVGAALGIGQGYTFNLDTFGAKLRVAGDLVYGESWLPQIAVGLEHKRSRDGALVRALGSADDEGTDYTISATKLVLARSLLMNATLRYTEANQIGLLGFGSATGGGYQLQFEGSLGYQLSSRAVVGAEYRSKPDNLGLGEDDWIDIFAAYALTNHLTLTAAYVDLGSVATFNDQRGGFLSAQVAF